MELKSAGRRDITMLDQSMSEQQTNVGKIINSKSINLLLTESPALGNTVVSRSKTKITSKASTGKIRFSDSFFLKFIAGLGNYIASFGYSRLR